MNKVSEYQSPWYKVVDSEDNYLFEVKFYSDPSEFGSNFTFDSDGNDWICHKLDPDNFVICAELMSDYMNRSVNRYYDELNEITYGYVEVS